ncbi:transketolase [Candidatus Pseudothioglobus singularis]|nr:transketolase [Candidatus Pseudothioglobus singularis]
MKLTDLNTLEDISKEIRLRILDIVFTTPGGHIGGCYSVADILVTLYYGVLNHDPKNSKWPDRDFLILSKGHCCLALYSILEKCGYFNKNFLEQYSCNGGLLGGHPKKDDAPGIEATTGSLGHGLSIGTGIAWAHKIKKKSNRVFVVLSDGEMNEGSTWEALMFASQQRLNNLTIVIDNNKLESLDLTDNILSNEPLDKRLEAFGWSVKRVNGHKHDEIFTAINPELHHKEKPIAIVADTIKGKGVSFMEGSPKWHYRKLKLDEYKVAQDELKRKRNA